MKPIVHVCELVGRAAVIVMCLALLAAGSACPAAAQQGEPATETDEDYEKLLEESPEYRARIEQIDSLLVEDEELEASYLAYQDSLSACPGLEEQERDFVQAVAEDTVLARRLEEFEEAAAADPGAAEQIARMDSLLAAEPELADRIEELEAAAADDPELLESFWEQMAYLETHPKEAEEFFGDEDGPVYPGDDPDMVEFVYYLEDHPRLFLAYWRLYDYLKLDLTLAPKVYRHWRWYGPRWRLWRASWRYRLWAARSARIHKIVWERRLFLGRRPWLARHIRAHHFLVASRPAARRIVWRHRVFTARHPKYSRSVARHRWWVKKHGLTPAKSHAPKSHVKAKPKAKPKAKARPKKRR